MKQILLFLLFACLQLLGMSHAYATVSNVKSCFSSERNIGRSKELHAVASNNKLQFTGDYSLPEDDSYILSDKEEDENEDSFRKYISIGRQMVLFAPSPLFSNYYGSVLKPLYFTLPRGNTNSCKYLEQRVLRI